eukprot:Skav214376  [mRNA]  locus=scaffold4284:20275:22930:- [translate_table: standard]
MKYDVTKQEINFFHVGILDVPSVAQDQREWTERCLAESSTATRAAALDSQAPLLAAKVSFREKMAKYISILQHSLGTQLVHRSELEINRTRMRAELDALVADHKAQWPCHDKGCAAVLCAQVERLFRALEPTQVEWRIEKAQQKAKELRKPLAVKSPTFGIRGAGHLEFFPDGHNNSPEGKAKFMIRLFGSTAACLEAHIRYQCWVGKSSEGPRELQAQHMRTPGDNLSVDMYLTDWEDESRLGDWHGTAM